MINENWHSIHKNHWIISIWIYIPVEDQNISAYCQGSSVCSVKSITHTTSQQSLCSFIYDNRFGRCKREDEGGKKVEKRKGRGSVRKQKTKGG